MVTVLRQDRAPGAASLPRPLTTFVGRERDVAAAANLLCRPDVRLLTLTGPGGVGKSRLALEVAASLDGDFSDGLRFVQLAPVSDPDLLPDTIAQALGLRDTGDRSVRDVLLDYLASRQLLLVLDNFEQVVEAAPLIADFLTAAPAIKALITSRMPLRVGGEFEFPVAPLSVGRGVGSVEPGTEAHTADARHASPEPSPAVALFVERARAVRPDFALTEANAATIAEICARLDGLPLAIELAAARTKLLSPQALHARLVNRLQVLTGGARDLPERQRTLRDTVAWSYDLLPPAEQALFRRLSVFNRGFTIEGAEAVGGKGAQALASRPAPPVPPALSLLDSIAALVDHSLVVQEETPSGESRYRMLETIREFAQEQLVAAGEADAAHRAHLAYFADLAVTGSAEVVGPEQATWLDRLDAEHHNLQAAIAWALDHDEVEAARRIAGSLWRFWVIRGHLHTGRHWLDRVVGSLDLSAEPPTASLSLALNAAGALAEAQGDYATAIAWHKASLNVARALGDRPAEAAALNNLGNIAHDQGEYDRARRCHDESLAISRAIGDQRGIARSLANIGVTALYEGRYDDSAAALNACLPILEALGDRHGQGIVINNLGVLASRRGQWDEAIRRNEEALALRRAINDPIGIGSALVNLAEVRLALGELEAAAPLLDESEAIFRTAGDRRALAVVLHNRGKLGYERSDDAAGIAAYLESATLFREVGDRAALADCLEGLAEIAVAQDQPDSVARGVRALAAAAAIREALGAPAPDPAAIEATRITARERLGTAAFERAWAAAGDSDPEAVLRDVAAVELNPNRPRRLHRSAPGGAAKRLTTRTEPAMAAPPNPAGLTARELEVLRLLALGRSTEEIADALFISRRTATTHVGNILGKLGVNTRAAAVAYAYQHQLI